MESAELKRGTRITTRKAKVATTKKVALTGKKLAMPARALQGRAFKEFYDLDPLGLVVVVKEGLPATMVVRMAAAMRVTNEHMYQTLGLPRTTLMRKIRENQSLSSDESSRVLGLARLVGQVEAMVEESGSPEGFDAASWVAKWLEQPLPALGSRKPEEFMDTSEGQAIVANLIDRIQSGAYA